MDRFFVDKKNIDLENKVCKITGDDVKHIYKVLRCKTGDELEICDKENTEYIGKIFSIDKNEVLLDIIKEVDIKRESDLKVRLYQGLPKSTKMEIILQKLTEIGVDEIVLVQTKRSVAKIEDKKEDKKLERWERIIYEASKQSKRGKIPKLRGILSFKEALEDIENNNLNIACYENEKTNSIKNSIKGVNIDSIGIFIGPEGGFDEEEIKLMEKNDVKSVSLGNRILRTETASVVASSIVLYELSDLGGN